MKRLLLVFGLCTSFLLPALSQNPALDARRIPKSLQAYANAVVRLQEQTVEVKGLDQVIHKRREVITILNPQGADYAEIAVFYDKARQLKSLKASIYDQEGRLIKKVGQSDFQDVSAISDISLFEDNRVKFYDPLVSYYPYTVEYEYEMWFKHSFYFPEWVPQKAGDIAVENSTYRFISKPGYEVRILERNLATPRQETATAKTVVKEWRTASLPALRPEPYSPPAEAFITTVEIAPVQFQYEGYTGSFTDWQSYGKWVYDHLIKGRDALPPATVAKVQELVQDARTPAEKVQRIYAYSQQKNRYISVQIGIGGLQPMRAEEVDRLSYGDCKALTNYTKALLQAAGIPALYTEVYAGNRKKNYLTDFASAFQGNHAILCVPLAQDTIWLECTSRTNPMGYLGKFTDDRKVLLCTENGGVIARTRRYQAEQNRQLRTAAFDLSPEGVLTGRVETRFEGTQYENREGLLDQTPRDKIAAVKKTYPINNLEVLQFDLVQEKTLNPVTVEKMQLRAASFATVNNNLLFVPLNQLNREISVPKEVRNRKNNVQIARGFMDEDVIQFNLPPDFQADYIPAPVNLQTPFGSYQAQAVLKGRQLVYSRKLLLNQGEFGPDTYQQLYDFLKKVVDADQEKVVLAKK